MAFQGWPAKAIDFFVGLEADNTKAYWEKHKPDYETLVREPMEDLLEDLAPEFGDGKIFRPYRDVRFSPDKTPYKTAIAASLEKGGYVQFSAEGLFAGSGMYVMATDQLERYRHAVDADRPGGELERLVTAIKSQGTEVGAHESLKTAPRGYPKDHPRIELLRHKGLVVWTQWPAGAWLRKASAKDRVVEFLRTVQPINDWLGKHVGPSTLPDDRWGPR